MPLLRYFVTTGGVLTALLLLVGFVLGPSKPESPARDDPSGIETIIRKPRTTTGFADGAAGMFPRVPAAEARYGSSETTGLAAEPEPPPPARDEAERAPQAKPKPRTAQKAATGGRDSQRSGYRSYAQGSPYSRSSAEGTLGPH